MYVNTFGCNIFENVYVETQDKDPTNIYFWCDTPVTNYVLAPVYFISFVVISSLVMMSLFIGAVTMSMTESMEDLKKMAKKQKKDENSESTQKSE